MGQVRRSVKASAFEVAGWDRVRGDRSFNGWVREVLNAAVVAVEGLPGPSRFVVRPAVCCDRGWSHRAGIACEYCDFDG